MSTTLSHLFFHSNTRKIFCTFNLLQSLHVLKSQTKLVEFIISFQNKYVQTITDTHNFFYYIRDKNFSFIKLKFDKNDNLSMYKLEVEVYEKEQCCSENDAFWLSFLSLSLIINRSLHTHTSKIFLKCFASELKRLLNTRLGKAWSWVEIWTIGCRKDNYLDSFEMWRPVGDGPILIYLSTGGI